MLGRADRLQQLLAVVGEDVDRLHVVVDDPDALLHVVRRDVDRVRAAEQPVPLLPRLEDVALAVVDDEAVLPVRVDTELPVGRSLDADFVVHPLPRREPLPHVLIGAARAGERRNGRIAPETCDGEADARPDLRQADRLGRLDVRQLAAIEAVNAVGRFGKHAFAGAVGPFLVAGQRRDVLRPTLDDLVGSRDILRADSVGDRGEAACSRGRLRLSLDSILAVEEQHGKGGAESEGQKRHGDFAHV